MTDVSASSRTTDVSSPGTIRRLQTSELDSSQYRDLAEALFGDGCWERHRRYCGWLYVENPAAERADTVGIYVCEHEGRFVGQTGLLPFDMLLRGERRRGGWVIDHYILPEYQRKQIGGRFHRAAAGDLDVIASLGMTDGAYSLAKKGGWHDSGRTTRYSRLLRPLRWARKKAMAMVSPGANVPPQAETFSIATRLANGVEVSTVASAAELPASFDTGALGDGVSTRICRSRSFLQWRYLDNPFWRYSAARLCMEGHESLAVWRLLDVPPFRRGVLIDLLHTKRPPADVLAALASAILELVKAAGADVFECQTSDRAFLDALPRGVLSRQVPGMQFVYLEGKSEPTPLIPCEDWRLYPGDCDVDTFMARNT